MKSRHFLEVDNLSVEFRTRDGIVSALKKISLHIDKGEVMGIVGESGSGKSVTAYSIIGLLNRYPCGLLDPNPERVRISSPISRACLAPLSIFGDSPLLLIRITRSPSSA